MNTRFDYVVRNEVLKAQEVLENKARKDWHKKWGFYLEFDQISLQEAQKKGISAKEYKTMVEYRKSKEQSEKDIWKMEVADHVPRTSSEFVGWRSSFNNSLEKLGPLYISPRHTLPHQPPYNCIILG